MRAYIVDHYDEFGGDILDRDGRDGCMEFLAKLKNSYNTDGIIIDWNI